MKQNKYAEVAWTADDVLDLEDAPEEWIEKDAEKWLNENQKYIIEAMIQTGWNVIESLLPARSTVD